MIDSAELCVDRDKIALLQRAKVCLEFTDRVVVHTGFEPIDFYHWAGGIGRGADYIAAFHSFLRAVDRFTVNAGLFGHFLSECSAVFDVGTENLYFFYRQYGTHKTIMRARLPARSD